MSRLDLSSVSDEDLKREWARRSSNKRIRKTGGHNGGRKPICGNCGRKDCASCKRRGIA